MAKNYSETHMVSINGVLDINENGSMNIEVEDVGAVAFSDVFKKFNGEPILLTVMLKTELD